MTDQKILFKSGNFSFELTREQLAKVPLLKAKYDEGLKKTAGGYAQVIEVSLDPVYLEPVVKYVKTNRARILFSSLPETGTASVLFRMLDTLGVPKPQTTLESLNKDITNIWSSIVGKNGFKTTADRSLARDSCVILCWKGMDLVKGHLGGRKINSLVKFILANPKAFYWNLRRLTLDWYMTSFKPAENQAKELKKLFEKKNDPSHPLEFDSDESSSGGSQASDSDNSDED